jgi:hypothetical protein
MLGLIAETMEFHRPVKEKDDESTTVLINDIVRNLNESKLKAEMIGDKEIQYLTSIALESAKEKFLLNFYNNSKS